MQVATITKPQVARVGVGAMAALRGGDAAKARSSAFSQMAAAAAGGAKPA
jgi:hypothetical protein